MKKAQNNYSKLFFLIEVILITDKCLENFFIVITITDEYTADFYAFMENLKGQKYT